MLTSCPAVMEIQTGTSSCLILITLTTDDWVSVSLALASMQHSHSVMDNFGVVTSSLCVSQLNDCLWESRWPQSQQRLTLHEKKQALVTKSGEKKVSGWPLHSPKWYMTKKNQDTGGFRKSHRKPVPQWKVVFNGMGKNNMDLAIMQALHPLRTQRIGWGLVTDPLT